MPGHLLTPERVRSIVTVPVVAFPTVLLAISCLVGVIAVCVAFYQNAIDHYVCCGLNTIFIFGSFTPLHDAAHGSIAKKQFRWLNDFVGIMCGFIMFLPYHAFRYLHLQHHQHTNDVDKDPDAWTSFGPWYLLPLRWMTIEYHHYSCYLSRDVFFSRNMTERVLAIGQIAINIGIAFFCHRFGLSSVILWGWIIPGRIAVFFLALFFDYLPHRPHSHTRKESEYMATSLIALWPSKSSVSLLTLPLLYQNYHNIHHLVPYIPFYMYKKVWSHCSTELEAEGTQTIPIFGLRKKID
jgi:fatty acid desaturase